MSFGFFSLNISVLSRGFSFKVSLVNAKFIKFKYLYDTNWSYDFLGKCSNSDISNKSTSLFVSK